MPVSPSVSDPRLHGGTTQFDTKQPDHLQKQINYLKQLITPNELQEKAIEGIHALSPEDVNWLCEFAAQEHALLIPHLNKLLANEVLCNPTSKMLLQNHPHERETLLILFGHFSPKIPLHFNAIGAYIEKAPQWLCNHTEHLLSGCKYKTSEHLNDLFGLTITKPELASQILAKLMNRDLDANEALEQNICEPTVQLYINTQNAKNNTEPHLFDEQLARNPFMRVAAQSAPLHFQPTTFNDPFIFPEALLGFENSEPASTVSGLSRSTIQPKQLFKSRLISEFNKRHAELKEATFGVEYEMYVPGLSKNSQLSKKFLAKEFDEIPNFFQVEEDPSLNNVAKDFHKPMELVSTILKTPEDIANLQNVLSRFNDLGAKSDQKSGVHIHIGIQQWNCASLGLRNHPNAAWWDEPIEPGLSRLQFALIQQIVINFSSEQHVFYSISRLSDFNAPIGHRKNTGHLQNSITWSDFSEAIHRCTNLFSIGAVIHSSENYLEQHISDERSRLLPTNSGEALRYHAINTKAAFAAHGTIEFRGFTKAFSHKTEVDPNMPVRDLIYLQDLLKISLKQIKNHIKTQPIKKPMAALKPHQDIGKITKSYVQDSLRLGLIHALSQRIPHQREETMQWFIKNRKLIGPELKKDIKNRKFNSLINQADAAGHWFLEQMLKPTQSLQPIHHATKIRRASLRETADKIDFAINRKPSTKLSLGIDFSTVKQWIRSMKKPPP